MGLDSRAERVLDRIRPEIFTEGKSVAAEVFSPFQQLDAGFDGIPSRLCLISFL